MRVLIFLGFMHLLYAERIRYDGCNSWFLHPKGTTQLEHLNQLYRENDNADKKILFLSNIRRNSPTEVIVCPEGEREFEEFLSKSKIQGEIVVDNIQRFYDETFARSEARHKFSKFAYDDDDYNTYEDIMQQLEVLREECPPDVVCGTRSIGDSYEGRSLQMFTIHKPGENRQAIWVDALIHSGEWLTGTTVMGILTKLVREYGRDADVTRLVDNYDWFFLPVMNPDGYHYTWNEVRTWRKNMSPNEDSECFGKDMNRNYDFLWGNDDGSSNNPCSNNFRGESAASEIETQHVQREGEALADRLILWMTFHVSGWVYLIPFGHEVDGECYQSPDEPDMLRVGQAGVDAVTNTFNEREWTTGNTCVIFYETSGTTQDWVKGANIAKYIYTPELRGPGAVRPPEDIAPSVLENWNGLVAIVREIELVESGQ